MEQQWNSIDCSSICVSNTNAGTRCTKVAKFQHVNYPDWFVCSQHTRAKKHKNTMLNREGSWKYAICMSLHVANTPHAIETHDDTMDTSVCFYCKKNLKDSKLTRSFDHIYNLIDKGGKPTNKMIIDSNNKVFCCSLCNSSKGNKDVIKWAVEKDLSRDMIRKIEDRKRSVPIFEEDVYINKILKPFEISTALIKEISLWLASGDYSSDANETLLSKIRNILCE